MTPEQKAERLELIKKVAKKINFKKNLKKKSGYAMNKAKPAEKVNPVKSIESFLAGYDDNKNINRWTDERKYAQKYYGDVYRETTRFDDEWN
jgi:endo-1,4-beta-D-glucanase Y